MEPKQKVADYGRLHRPHIRFLQGEAENIPFPEEYFDKIIVSFSFHHFPNQDRSLEEMKRVLKLNGMLVIVESDPTLKEKVERCGLHVASVDPTSIGYFLTATKDT